MRLMDEGEDLHRTLRGRILSEVERDLWDVTRAENSSKQLFAERVRSCEIIPGSCKVVVNYCCKCFWCELSSYFVAQVFFSPERGMNILN